VTAEGSTLIAAREHPIKPRSTKSPNYQYEPLVGDPCYRYNKHAKEKFFKNIYLAFLFVQFTYYQGNEFIANKQWREPHFIDRD
jgi:hypothetical protein